MVVHDDGSANGMFDLLVGTKETPEIAIECVGAVDPEFTETWNVGPARGPLHLDIPSDWGIMVKPSARYRGLQKIKENGAALLSRLEARGLFDVRANYIKWIDPELFSELEALRVDSVFRYRAEGTGTVHLNMGGDGGVVDQKGNAVPEWVGEFLRAPARADVLRKLIGVEARSVTSSSSPHYTARRGQSLAT